MNKKNDDEKSYKAAKTIFILSVVFMFFFFIADAAISTYYSSILVNRTNITGMAIEDMEYTSFLSDVENGLVSSVYQSDAADFMYVTLNDSDSYFRVTNPQYDSFKKDMIESGIDVYPLSYLVTPEDKYMQYQRDMTSIGRIYAIAILAWLIVTLIKRSRGKFGPGHAFRMQKPKAAADSKTNSGFFSFGSTVPESDDDVVTFDDVVGLYEVKEDLKRIPDYLSNRQKYVSAGAELPKGILLYGPPGTGKTYLAKAISHEANVPFFYISGSSFVNTFVGVGASNIRDLFDTAKKYAPSIIFVDEIDALGNRDETHNEEYKSAINEFLVQMNGFSDADNVIVIGATNKLDKLDPALIRSGRFTNKYCVPLPQTPEERLEIIEKYAKGKKFAKEIDFENLAKSTCGYSPSDLKAILNEAAILSVQRGGLNEGLITKAHLEEALFQHDTDSHANTHNTHRSEEELRVVAWHEAGHAVIGRLIGSDVNKVTIVSSTSGAGGITKSIPYKEKLLNVNDIHNYVMQLYGGRIAEFMLYGDPSKVTTGASSDIERASQLIEEMVVQDGMCDSFGLLNLRVLKVPQDMILQKEIEIAKDIEKEARALLKEHKALLKDVAEALYKRETLYGTDLDEIFAKHDLLDEEVS